jgi:hypothetical protein
MMTVIHAQTCPEGQGGAPISLSGQYVWATLVTHEHRLKIYHQLGREHQLTDLWSGFWGSALTMRKWDASALSHK